MDHWSVSNSFKWNIQSLVKYHKINYTGISHSDMTKFIYYQKLANTLTGGSSIPGRSGCQPWGRGAGHQHTILPNFPKNYMKLRTFWAVGGVCPLRSATGIDINVEKELKHECLFPYRYSINDHGVINICLAPGPYAHSKSTCGYAIIYVSVEIYPTLRQLNFLRFR